MSSGDWRPKDEDEDEDEIEEPIYKTTKDAILFAIEVSPSMLRKPKVEGESKKVDRDSPVLAALKCAYQIMQQRVISNPNDVLGILLFGTEKSRNLEDGDESSGKGDPRFPHCYLLTPLDLPEANEIKRLKALVNDESEEQDLLVAATEPVLMSNVLFLANQIFATRAANFTSRRLFLITDEDNPHAKDKTLRSTAMVRAKDLYDLGVVIELFPISSPEKSFDRNKFYDDVIYSTATELDGSSPNDFSSAGEGINLLQSLVSSVKSKTVPRRALFSHVKLELGPELSIGVKGYLMFKRQTVAKTCWIWLGGEQPQVAKFERTGMTAETGSGDVDMDRATDPSSGTQSTQAAQPKVESKDIVKAYKFGGEAIHFTTEEAAAIRFFENPVIRILGFRSQSWLPFWARIKEPIFIYPSEDDFVGSSRVYSALHATMTAKKRLALVWFIPRKNAQPVVAALWPGQEVLGDMQEQLRPAGLWLIPLPFADDLRKNPDMTLYRAPDELTDKMRVIVQQLQLPKGVFMPEKYPSPALQWHYKILQAMALDEDLPQLGDDKTVPKYRQIDKRAGQYIVEWGEALDKACLEAEASTREVVIGKKRPADGEADGEPKKRRPNVDAGDVDMKKLWENNNVSKQTVGVLKSWLEAHSLDTSGKKADLVDRVEQFYESK